jgi:flagellar hook assembly protein FlgD
MQNVELVIYDITGRLVEIIVDEKKEAGVYQVEWDGKDQPSGIYFYRLQSGDFTTTKKLILLK